MGTGPTPPPLMPHAPESEWTEPSPPPTPTQQPIVTKQTTIVGYLTRTDQLTCTSLVQATAPTQDLVLTLTDQPLADSTSLDQDAADGYQVDRVDTLRVTKESEQVTNNKKQVPEDCNQQIPAPSTSNNKNDKEESHCEYKRGGFCKVHEIQGSKYWIHTRTWKKKSNGTYGYVNGRKVGYKCSSLTQFLPPSSTDEKVNPIFNTDGVVGNTANQRVLSTFATYDLDNEATQNEK